MKRLIVTGLPCPPERWEKFLGPREDQRILPLFEVFENTTSNDLRVMSKYVAGEIEKYRPESIICHDFGVPLTLLSLLRLNRKKSPLRPKVTIFNGAFRKVDLFKAPIPFRVQFMRRNRAAAMIRSDGGDIDPRLAPYLPRIRAMCRLVILFRITEKIQSLLGLEDLLDFGTAPIRAPIQIIASGNDPYLPFKAIEQLDKDFAAKRFVHIDYGHFPYSIDRNKIIPIIEQFESSH